MFVLSNLKKKNEATLPQFSNYVFLDFWLTAHLQCFDLILLFSLAVFKERS